MLGAELVGGAAARTRSERVRSARRQTRPGSAAPGERCQTDAMVGVLKRRGSLRGAAPARAAGRRAKDARERVRR